MAWWIRTRGEQTNVSPANGTSFTLQEIYRMINGGPMETYRISDDEWLVCNEHGKMMNLEPNPRATAIFNLMHLHTKQIQDIVVGNAIIATTEELNGPEEEEEDDTAQG